MLVVDFKGANQLHCSVSNFVFSAARSNTGVAVEVSLMLTRLRSARSSVKNISWAMALLTQEALPPWYLKMALASVAKVP